MLKTILRISSVMTLLGGAVSSTVACGDDNNFNLGNYKITSIEVTGEQTKHFSDLTAFAKTSSTSDIPYDYYVIAHANNDQRGELVEGGYDFSIYYRKAQTVDASQLPSDFSPTDENILHLWKVTGHPKGATNPTNFLFLQTENMVSKQKELWYSPVNNGKMTGLKQFKWSNPSSNAEWTNVQNVKVSQGFLVLQLRLNNKDQNLLINTNITAQGSLPFGVYKFPGTNTLTPVTQSKLTADNPPAKIKLIYYDYQNQNLLWDSDSNMGANNLLWSHIAMQETPSKDIVGAPLQKGGFNNIVNNIYWSPKASYIFISTTNGIFAAKPEPGEGKGYQTPLILSYDQDINNNINYFSYDNSTSGDNKFIIESNNQSFYDIKADATPTAANWQWHVSDFGGTEGINKANFIRNGDFVQASNAPVNSPFFLIGSRSYGLFIKDSITGSFIRTNKTNYNCLSAVAFSKQIIITSSLNSGLFLITS